MSIHDFIHTVFVTSYESPICGIPVIKRLNPASVNIRVPVNNDQFVNVFFNEHTGRTAFALIKDKKRIFGADNTGDWHIHPWENPQSHNPVDSPVSFADFIEMIEQQSP